MITFSIYVKKKKREIGVALPMGLISRDKRAENQETHTVSFSGISHRKPNTVFLICPYN